RGASCFLAASREWDVLQFRRELVRPLEFLLSLVFLALLPKCEGEIVVRFGVCRFQTGGFGELRLCFADVSGLQQYQPEVIVALGKGGITAQQIAEGV